MTARRRTRPPTSSHPSGEQVRVTSIDPASLGDEQVASQVLGDAQTAAAPVASSSAMPMPGRTSAQRIAPTRPATPTRSDVRAVVGRVERRRRRRPCPVGGTRIRVPIRRARGPRSAPSSSADVDPAGGNVEACTRVPCSRSHHVAPTVGCPAKGSSAAGVKIWHRRRRRRSGVDEHGLAEAESRRDRLSVRRRDTLDARRFRADCRACRPRP